GNGTGAGTLIPDDAVQLVQNKLHVFLAFPDGKGGARFQSREVVVGARSGGRIEVLRGISSSDVIVLKGAFAVKAEMVKGSMPKMEM
ncbi:MAG: hypothetical protein ABJB74_13820, partial [Gemmatimonas sp.]